MLNLNNSGIYKITNLINQKVYIGQTDNIAIRRKVHLLELKKGIHSNKGLQQDFNELGEDSLCFECLEVIKGQGERIDRERFWINHYYSISPNLVYNDRFQIETIQGMKVCSKSSCIHNGQPQPLENFANRKKSKDGKDFWCKDCKRQWTLGYNKTEAKKESILKYGGSEKYYAARRRYRKTDKYREMQHKYNQTEKGKATKRRQDRKNALKYKTDSEHKAKVLARNHVYYHIEAGNIQPVSEFVCVKCNERQAQEYHHYLGYGREHWLDVEAVCILCHRNLEPDFLLGFVKFPGQSLGSAVSRARRRNNRQLIHNPIAKRAGCSPYATRYCQLTG
jgi:hypothetical protein